MRLELIHLLCPGLQEMYRGQKCFDLETKKIVVHRTVTPLPMPDRVVRLVLALGRRAHQV